MLVALVSLGCTHQGELVAEGGSHRLTAHDEATGLTAILTTGVWEGTPPDLDRQWTVLHVLVANLGAAPVLLAPGDWELRDLRGFSYPLIDTGATFFPVAPDEVIDVGGYGREVRRDYDPGGPVDFIPIEAGGDIGRHALPWGVLEPGTQMRGYLYFEELTQTANGGTLVWHAITPTHEPLADFRFELRVARSSRAG